MKKIVKVNCKNRIIIEGYAKDINFFVEEKEGKTPRNVLEFLLYSVNINSKEIAYATPIKVYVYNNRAVMVKEWIEDMMLVEVEGQLRLQPNGQHNIQGVYIINNTPILRKISIGEDNNKKGDENGTD